VGVADTSGEVVGLEMDLRIVVHHIPSPAPLETATAR
jgi:hypothetical protein